MRSKIEANEYKRTISSALSSISSSRRRRLLVCVLRLGEPKTSRAWMRNDAETVQYVRDLCGYFISYNNLFSTWIASQGDFTIADVRDALSAFERNIDPARKRVFVGIFDTLQTGLSKLGTDEKS